MEYIWIPNLSIDNTMACMITHHELNSCIEPGNVIKLMNREPCSTKSSILYRVVQKRGNPLLVAILKYFLGVINFAVYIFIEFRLSYVSGEKNRGKRCKNESATLI